MVYDDRGYNILKMAIAMTLIRLTRNKTKRMMAVIVMERVLILVRLERMKVTIMAPHKMVRIVIESQRKLFQV